MYLLQFKIGMFDNELEISLNFCINLDNLTHPIALEVQMELMNSIVRF